MYPRNVYWPVYHFKHAIYSLEVTTLVTWEIDIKNKLISVQWCSGQTNSSGCPIMFFFLFCNTILYHGWNPTLDQCIWYCCLLDPHRWLLEVDEYPSTLVVFSTVVKNIDIGDYIIISVLTLRCLTCFMFAFYYIVSKPHFDMLNDCSICEGNRTKSFWSARCDNARRPQSDTKH